MTAPSHNEPLPPGMLRTLLVVSFGPLLLNVAATTLNVALDGLMVRFAAPLATMQWTITAYLLALTVVLPAFRWIVERTGARRLFLACMVGFAATSALCALAWSAPSLIVFRVLQGAVAGLLAPLTQTLAAQLVGPKRMGRAVAILSIPVLVAPVFGPALGGLVVEHLSWRWIFLMNVPLALGGAALAHGRLPAMNGAGRSRFDAVGFALLSPAVGLFTFAVASLSHTQRRGAEALLPFAISSALLAVFVVDARRRPETALLDLRLFRRRAVTAGLVAFLLTNIGSFGAQLLFPLYFQQVRGASAVGAGMLLAPQGLGMLLTLPQIGRLTERVDHGRLVAAGVLVTLAGTLAFVAAARHGSIPLIALSLALRGAGLGATSTPALAAAYAHLAHDEIPNATAAINVVQRLGAPLGTAAAAVMFQRSVAALGGASPTREALAAAFERTFVAGAAVGALALVAALALVRQGPATPPR